MTTSNRRYVGLVLFEAVRVQTPIPHWRAKVVETGYVFEPGVFKCKSRPQLWASIADKARRRGATFYPETMTAHLPLMEQIRLRKEGYPGIDAYGPEAGSKMAAG